MYGFFKGAATDTCGCAPAAEAGGCRVRPLTRGPADAPSPPRPENERASLRRFAAEASRPRPYPHLPSCRRTDRSAGERGKERKTRSRRPPSVREKRGRASVRRRGPRVGSVPSTCGHRAAGAEERSRVRAPASRVHVPQNSHMRLPHDAARPVPSPRPKAGAFSAEGRRTRCSRLP